MAHKGNSVKRVTVIFNRTFFPFFRDALILLCCYAVLSFSKYNFTYYFSGVKEEHRFKGKPTHD